MILPIMDFMIEGPIPTKKSPARYENYIYLLEEDKILKLAITIDKEVIKCNMLKLKNYLSVDKFEIVDEEAMNNFKFPIEMDFVGKYKLNKKRKTNNYKIPKEQCFENDLFYYLNSMYSKVSLTSTDLSILYIEKDYCISEPKEKLSIVWLSAIEDIVSNLNIEIIDEYEYTKLSESLDYIEKIRNKEGLWSTINLTKIKSILGDAKGNTNIFLALNLSIKKEQEKQKVK